MGLETAPRRVVVSGTIDNETGPTSSQYTIVYPGAVAEWVTWYKLGTWTPDYYVIRDKGDISFTNATTYDNQPSRKNESNYHFWDYKGKITGSAFDDRLYGAGNVHEPHLLDYDVKDIIDGGAGNDFIDGRQGDDILMGGSGNDTIYGGSQNDKIWGGLDNDSLFGDWGNDTIYGGAGADTIDGGLDQDQLFGGTGNDVIRGGAGNDSIEGGIGNDTLTGGTHTDTIKGGEGNDFISTQVGGTDTGIDQLWGGSGTNTFIISATPELAANSVDKSSSGNGFLSALGSPQEVLLHSIFAGLSAVSAVPGMPAWARFFTKAAGEFGTLSMHGVTAAQNTDANTIAIAKDVYDTETAADFAKINDFNGGEDQLILKWKTDIPLDENGNEVSKVEMPLDYAFGTSFDENSGFDIIDRSGTSAKVIARVAWKDLYKQFSIPDGGTLPDGLQKAYVKSLMDNALIISKDELKFGDGRIVRKDQVDTSQFDQLAKGEFLISIGNHGGVVDYATTTDKFMFGSKSNDVLWGYRPDNVDGLVAEAYEEGSSPGQKFYGLDGDDLFIPGAGNSRLYGGTGSDTADFRDAVQVDVDLNGTKENPANALAKYRITARSTKDADINMDSIENIVGGAGNDTITGNGEANILAGAGGNDSISGGGGKDTLSGGAGNDTVLGDAGDDVLVSISGNDELTGGAGADTFVLKGGYARIMDYQAGDSIEIDASGYPGFTSLFTAFENGGQLVYTMVNGRQVNIAFFVGATATNPVRFEDIVIKGPGRVNGTSGNDRLTGIYESAHDTVYGGAGNDTIGGGNGDVNLNGHDLLDGGSGNDQLRGGWGNDTLVSGTGNDFLEGGAGRDTFVLTGGYNHIRDYQANFDQIYIDSDAYGGVTSIQSQFVTGGQRIYTVINGAEVNIAFIEGATAANPLRLSDVYIRQTGDTQSNTLTGTDGNDILRGLDWNDTLVSGAGNDYMVGDAGYDRFVLTGGYNHIADYEAGVDQIFIDSSAYGGATSFQSQFTPTGQRIYTVVNGVEVNIARIDGATAANPLRLSDVFFRQTGDAQANTLTGGANRDVLIGGGGADTLVSGAGDDFLQGGAGADTFDLTGGYNHIWDYEAGLDQIYIDSNVYGGATSYQSQFTPTGQRIYTMVDGAEVNIAFIEGATAANPLRLSDVLFRQTGDAQANTLTGSANRDILIGGGGADTLVSGDGNDYMVGAQGFDRFVLTGGYNHIANYEAGVDQIFIDGSAYGGATSYQSQFTSTGQRIYTVINGAEVNIARIEGATAANPLRLSDVFFRQTGDAQANTLTGGANRDVLIGGGGADTLVSGAGNDFLQGDAGADTFVLSGGKNHVWDYEAGVDTIQIDSSAYGGATSILTQQLNSGQRIYALVNGAEVDIAVIEGITPATALTNSDFVFV